MANSLRLVKPTTSARRKMSYLTHEEITKESPEKSLVIPLKKHSGRDSFGHITIRHRGGGSKRKYRLIDFSLLKQLGKVAQVASIEYDPNRSAYIALVIFENGKKTYILAPKNLTIGMQIKTDQTAAITVGNRLPLENIPTSTPIYNIELTPGKGGQLVRSAGASALILAKE